MKPGKVRTIAIGVFRSRGRILAQEGYDPLKGQRFYRPLGGKIEFGELGAETVVRELGEELGVEAGGLRYLGTLENIFTYNGQPGHEIVRVYDGLLAPAALYEQAEILGNEDSGTPIRAVWVDLREYNVEGASDLPPVYPTGLIELLREEP